MGLLTLRHTQLPVTVRMQTVLLSSTAVPNVLTLVNLLQLDEEPLRRVLTPTALMTYFTVLKNLSHSMDTAEPTLTGHLTELDASSHVGSVHFCKPDMLRMYIYLWCSFW